jgi:acetyl esterase/lipase
MVKKSRFTGILVILWLASGIGQAQFMTPSQVNELTVDTPDQVIAYGVDSMQFGELRLPDGRGPYPVAIIIHGGCWLSKFASLENTAPISTAITRLGVATWNLEYRQVDNSGGGWPGTFQDVAGGIDFLKNVANKYNLDLKRVITLGHSAGGHLALWAAGRYRVPEESILYVKEPLQIKGVLALSAAVDLRTLFKTEESVCGEHVIPKLLGGTPAEIPLRYESFSPIECLPLGIPQVLVVGASDIPEIKAAAVKYRNRARETEDPVQLHIIRNAAHHEAVAPGSVAWETVRDAVLKLLGIGK